MANPKDLLDKHRLENNFLARQQSVEDRVSLLEKLGLEFVPDAEKANQNCCVYVPVPSAFKNIPFGIASIGLITHDQDTGMMYLNGLKDAAPHYLPMLDGLTSGQSQAITGFIITPNGTIYAVGAQILAWAPAAGGTFTVIEDATSISAKYGGSTDNVHMCALAFDPTQSERVLYAITGQGENVKTYLGSRNSWTHKTDFVHYNNGGASLSFGLDAWIFISNGLLRDLGADADATVSTTSIPLSNANQQIRVPSNQAMICWGGGEMIIIYDNGSSFSSVFTVPAFTSNSYLLDSLIASDVDGVYLMAGGGTLGGGGPYRSIDGGENWTAISSLPTLLVGGWYFAFVGGVGASSQWLAAGDDQLLYSEDFGDTWVDVSGDSTDLSPTPLFNAIRPLRGTVKNCVDDEPQVQALTISLSQFDPLSVHLTGALVPIPPHTWLEVETTDPDLDLSSYLPTSGALLAGIQFNKTTGVWSAVAGPEFDSSVPATIADIPVAEDGNQLVFFVALYANELEICLSDLIVPSTIPVPDYGTVAEQIHAAEEVTELSDDDEIGVWNSLTELLGKIKFSNLVAQLTSIFNLLYEPLGTTPPPSHVHGIERWNGASGQDTFDCVDICESVESITVDGLEADLLGYVLSADGTQIIFDTGLAGDSLVIAHTHLEILS